MDTVQILSAIVIDLGSLAAIVGYLWPVFVGKETLPELLRRRWGPASLPSGQPAPQPKSQRRAVILNMDIRKMLLNIFTLVVPLLFVVGSSAFLGSLFLRPGGNPILSTRTLTPTPPPTPTPTPTPTATPTPPKVEITFPTEGSKVGISIIAQGTASNIPQGENLWLLVNVSGINGYYPQDGPITVLSDGTWNASVAIGGPNDAGRPFVLLAALADQEGEATLEQYIKLGHASHLFPAIPLPKGVQVISLVHVVRQ